MVKPDAEYLIALTDKLNGIPVPVDEMDAKKVSRHDCFQLGVVAANLVIAGELRDLPTPKPVRRPSFDKIHMNMAWLVAQRSTCKRLNVGCVIASVDNRKIVSVGYNGNASGLQNTCDSDEPGKCGCVISGTPVHAANVIRAYRRRYEGEVIRIVTATGDFTVTPNHPILAGDLGFVQAQNLRKGDELINAYGGQDETARGPNNNDAISIDQIFESMLVSGRVVRRAGTRHDFHGDGIVNQNVDIVTRDGGLSLDGQTRLGQLFGDPSLAGSLGISPTFGRLGAVGKLIVPIENQPGAYEAVADNDHVNLVFLGEGDGRHSRTVQVANLSYGKIDHRLALMSDKILGCLAEDPDHAQPALDGCMGNVQGFGDRDDRFPRLITTSKVIGVERKWWSGHVFNLETANNWYCVGSDKTIIHNCLHAEQNAVINCDSPRDLEKVVYVTDLPCAVCAKFIVNLGHVVGVRYARDYRLREGEEILKSVGIPCAKIEGFDR